VQFHEQGEQVSFLPNARWRRQAHRLDESQDLIQLFLNFRPVFGFKDFEDYLLPKERFNAMRSAKELPINIDTNADTYF
jgi:hypothetical protein